jgi:tRNA pseudouridine38-40 synthase
MRRLRMVAEYDGTDFFGFQGQPGRRTVQGLLEQELGRLSGHPVAVVGAGRTDAGVHASGQVVHFDLITSIPAVRLEHAVNNLLPRDLLVRQAEETSDCFHARFDAVSRTYRYRLVRERPDPFSSRYVVFEPRLDLAAAARMREALAHLVGRHDFAGFARVGSEPRSTVRSLHRAAVSEREEQLTIELTADGFLRSMVRGIVGVLLKVGRGVWAPGRARELLADARRSAPIVTAPAHGLSLTYVDYADGYASAGTAGFTLPASSGGPADPARSAPRGSAEAGMEWRQ